MNWSNMLFTAFFLTVFAVITSVVWVINDKLIKMDMFETDLDGKEVKEIIRNKKGEIAKDYVGSSNQEDGILKIIYSNLEEVQEYYKITKQQYNKTFNSARFFCTIGCGIIFTGVIASFFKGATIALISSVSGAIIEAIAALFFYMHKQSIQQLNKYYEDLIRNERYFTAVEFSKQIDPSRRDEVLIPLIHSIISDKKSK